LDTQDIHLTPHYWWWLMVVSQQQSSGCPQRSMVELQRPHDGRGQSFGSTTMIDKASMTLSDHDDEVELHHY